MISGHRQLIVVKGMKHQQEDKLAKDVSDEKLNSKIGFKCLHYSVTEGAGTVKVVIVKKTEEALSVGIRTIDDVAIAGERYHAVDKTLNLKAEEKEIDFEVEIIDDD